MIPPGLLGIKKSIHITHPWGKVGKTTIVIKLKVSKTKTLEFSFRNLDEADAFEDAAVKKMEKEYFLTISGKKGEEEE